MLGLTLKVHGLEAVEEVLAMIREFGASPVVCQLRAKDRLQTELNNKKIIAGQIEQDHDFFTPDPDGPHLAAVYVRRATQGFEDMARKAAKKKHGSVPLSNQQIARQARNIDMVAKRDAMLAYCFHVRQRIQGQVLVDGRHPPELSEAYAKRKQKQFGFVYPVCVASGQLLDNFMDISSIQFRGAKEGEGE